MGGRAGGLCGQAESAGGARRSEFRVRGVLSNSATRGTREQYGGRVQGIRGEARGAEFSDGGGRLSEIVSGLAPEGGRQAQRDGAELHNPPAEWVSAEHRRLQCSEHSGAGSVYAAMGDAKVSYLDVGDIAVVAVKSLHGGAHAGKTYELNGPEAISNQELAKRISRVTGRAVNYVDR